MFLKELTPRHAVIFEDDCLMPRTAMDGLSVRIWSKGNNRTPEPLGDYSGWDLSETIKLGKEDSSHKAVLKY